MFKIFECWLTDYRAPEVELDGEFTEEEAQKIADEINKCEYRYARIEEIRYGKTRKE